MVKDLVPFRIKSSMKRILFPLIAIICFASCIRFSDSDKKTYVLMFLCNRTELENLAFESNLVPYMSEHSDHFNVKSEGSLRNPDKVLILFNEVRAVPYKYYKKIDYQGPYPLDITDMIQNDQDAYISIYRVEEDGTKTLLKTWYSSDRNKDGVQFFDLNQWKADRQSGSSYIPEIYFKFNLTKTDLGL